MKWARAHFFVGGKISSPAKVFQVLERVASEMVSRIESIAERVGESEGLQIVEVEVRGSTNRRLVRIYIYKPEGVTHGDCEKVSQQVGTILDVEDVIPGSYTLEVSSPGAERKLRTARDFALFRGRKARVMLREPVEGSKQWEGALAPAGEGRVGIEAADGKSVEFPLELVERANLKI